jgi:hypothetical protein
VPVARTGLRELDLRGHDDTSACTALMAQACDPEHASQERILVEALGNGSIFLSRSGASENSGAVQIGTPMRRRIWMRVHVDPVKTRRC